MAALSKYFSYLLLLAAIVNLQPAESKAPRKTDNSTSPAEPVNTMYDTSTKKKYLAVAGTSMLTLLICMGSMQASESWSLSNYFSCYTRKPAIAKSTAKAELAKPNPSPRAERHNALLVECKEDEASAAADSTPALPLGYTHRGRHDALLAAASNTLATHSNNVAHRTRRREATPVTQASHRSPTPRQGAAAHRATSLSEVLQSDQESITISNPTDCFICFETIAKGQKMHPCKECKNLVCLPCTIHEVQVRNHNKCPFCRQQPWIGNPLKWKPAYTHAGAPPNTGRGLNIGIQCPDRRCCSAELHWIHIPTFHEATGEVMYGEEEDFDGYMQPNTCFSIERLGTTLRTLTHCPQGTLLRTPGGIKAVGFLDCTFKIRMVKDAEVHKHKQWQAAEGDLPWRKLNVPLCNSYKIIIQAINPYA